MDYLDQLKDTRWLTKRVNILKRDRHRCVICGYFGPRVNVHHLKYTGMAWDAPYEDLITLCNDCHSKLHIDKWPCGKSVKELFEIWRKDS